MTRAQLFSQIYNITGNAHDWGRNDFGHMRELSEMRQLDSAILSAKREWRNESHVNLSELSRKYNTLADDYRQYLEGKVEN